MRRSKQRKTYHADIEEGWRKSRNRKRFQVLRIAPTSEANEISKIYGKVTRNSAEVRANLSGVSVKPGGGNEDHPRRGQHPRDGDDRQYQG